MWLTGWDKRIKITIDHTKIDSQLSHFPITLFLEAENGETNKVFDEVGDNKLKIAITQTDGETELCAEIEKWDSENKTGVIHLSKTGWDIPNDVDYNIYLYYDLTHADNDNIGDDPDDTASNAVWDTNYKMVQHMKNDTTSTIKDSTSNSNNGTKKGIGEPTEVNGKIGKAQDFDGVDDFVEVDALMNDIAESLIGTVSFWVKIASDNEDERDIFDITRDAIGADTELRIVCDMRVDHKWLAVGLEVDDKSLFKVYPPLDSMSSYIGEWLFITIVHDGIELKIYYNGISQKLTWQDSGETEDKTKWFKAILTDAINPSDTANIGILKRDGADLIPFEGFLDELRISNTDRSSSYIKASYNSGNDSLLSYGNEVEFADGGMIPADPKNHNGYLCFMQQYIKNKVADKDPLKLPDGTIW